VNDVRIRDLADAHIVLIRQRSSVDRLRLALVGGRAGTEELGDDHWLIIVIG
jgi:hypothetical protein